MMLLVKWWQFAQALFQLGGSCIGLFGDRTAGTEAGTRTEAVPDDLHQVATKLLLALNGLEQGLEVSSAKALHDTTHTQPHRNA